MSITRLPRAGLLATLVALGGCGLISSDITDFALRLPEREVTVDTADWQLGDSAEMPTIDCSGDQAGVCSQGIGQLCGAQGCFGSCGDGDTCEVTIAVSLFNTFNLASESPELQELDGQPLVSVTIERIYFAISENTLDVESPTLDVYLAPQDVMDPGDPLAKDNRIGTIEPIAPGEIVESGEIVPTEAGKEILSRFMKDYAKPFNVIVGSTVVFQAGDVFPTGRMVAVVKVDAHAGL